LEPAEYMKILGTLKGRFQKLLSPLTQFVPREFETTRGQTMFLKRIDGVRAVTLPNGRVLSQADLPAPDTTRWVASRKEAVVLAVRHGLVSRETALDRYDLSEEEFLSWDSAHKCHGSQALKSTSLQNYRQPARENGRND
jgi:hypothetical protein